MRASCFAHIGSCPLSGEVGIDMGGCFFFAFRVCELARLAFCEFAFRVQKKRLAQCSA